MFKFFSYTGRREFALTMIANLIVFAIFLDFCLLFLDDRFEFLVIGVGNLFCIALSSLFARRLRDAGFGFLLGLLPYAWILFWWAFPYFVDTSYDERTTIALLGFFGLIPIGFVVMLLCAFPSKPKKISNASQSSISQILAKESKNDFLQAWINLWKNIFRFQAPYRTGRKEFALSLLGGMLFLFLIMVCMVSIQNLIIGFILVVVLWLTVLALLSLSARRLRDAGFSAWLVCPMMIWFLCISPVFSGIGVFEAVFVFGLNIFEFYSLALLIMCAFPSKDKNSQSIK